ncbi:LolA family protein [Aceticella autotrophica]|uniref:LolA family protein n=1 Tax=Aceticella autotrophica TaxID=2755338 RepID=UPI002542B335|nr:outer membrane lipoprotein carrier protein LolA [Aceticella autotrophica]
MKFRIALLIFLIALFAGCGEKAKENAYESILKSLNGMKSYTADAEAELHSNNNTKRFFMKQFYKDGKYRIEIFDNEGKVDKIIMYDEKHSYVYFSKINQVFIEENSNDVPIYSMVTSFRYNLNKAGNIAKSSADIFTIATPIPDGNTYLYKEEMEFSKKGLKPQILKIYGIKGELYAKITYKNFVYNPDIKDKIFNKDYISTISKDMNINQKESIDLKDVYKYSGINPVLPVFMPEGYSLSNINIDKTSANSVYLTYLKGNDIIKIIESIEENNDKKDWAMKQADGFIYYKKGEAYDMYKNGISIKIISNQNISEKEVLKIFKSFK